MSASMNSFNPEGSYSWSDPLKSVYYGPGVTSSALPALLKALKVFKVLIVTGKSLNTKTDVIKKVSAVLEQNGVLGGVYAEIGQHSPIAGITNGMKLFRDIGANAIVSVGGGSPIDASKAMLYKIQHEDGMEAPHVHIAIPTTLSAAEYGIGAGFTSEEGMKVGVSSPQIAPNGIILDAEFTLATPERLWLSSGMRALDHAIENLYRPTISWPNKVLCYAAIADLFAFLPESKANPTDLKVRERLQVAAWMSMWPLRLEKFIAFGLSHSLGHRLGATYGIPHGITSCITLSHVVALQADIASPEHKQCLSDALTVYLHQPKTGSIEGNIRKLASMIDELTGQLGIHSTMKEYKVPEADLPKIAGPDATVPHYNKILGMLKEIY